MVSQPNPVQSNSGAAANAALSICSQMQGAGNTGGNSAPVPASANQMAAMDAGAGPVAAPVADAAAAPPLMTSDALGPDPNTAPTTPKPNENPYLDPLAPPPVSTVVPKRNSVQDNASKLNQSAAGRGSAAASTGSSLASMCAAA